MLKTLGLCWLTIAHCVAAACHEPSFAHQTPAYDAEHPVLKDAFKHIHDVLTIALEAPEYDSSSVSIEITSSKESLWEFHHTARHRNASRPDIPHVNGSALYRIASITKVFTVLGLLQQHVAGNLSLDDPVDKYISELREPQNGTIDWKGITLRSLASQLSGIPREMAQSDLVNGPTNMHQPLEQWGLPPVSREGLIECDEFSDGYKKPCNAEDLIKSVKSGHPVFEPNEQSFYSNVAFELIGHVLSIVTNQTYESYIEDAIFNPLQMSKSTFSKPPDSDGVIPRRPQYWDVDEGIQNPTGGIYTSSNDLSKFLRYVLSNYNNITNTLNWMHPASPSQDLHSFYGMPWEIFQSDRALSTSQRTIRFITKGGGLPGYSSLIILIPQYDLGITLLLAGPPDFFNTLLETTSIGAVRAAEDFAVSSLQQHYAGRFVAADPKLNSSMILEADHRGLVLTTLISNATDVLASRLMRHFGAPKDGSGAWYLQLVPTRRHRDAATKTGEIWRMHMVHERSEGDGERSVWDDFCPTDIDYVTYAGVQLNQVVLWRGANGIVYDVELSGFRANLTRIFAHAESSLPFVHGQERMEL